MKRYWKTYGITAALLSAALLSGCGTASEQPVLNPELTTTPVVTAAPPVATATPEGTAASPATAQPAGSEKAAQPQWKYPLAAADLFGGQSLPEDFLFPIRLWEDGSQFLFATSDGRVLRARWDGSAYSAEPVAERLDAGGLSSACVDSASKWLFATADKRVSGKTARSVVMVDLATTARFDLCDSAGWKSGDKALAREIQYAGGLALVRLLGQEEEPLEQWLIIDTDKKTFSRLDLSGFAAQHLDQWKQASASRLIALGEDKLLSLWSVRGAVQAGSQETDETRAYAFVLDRSGSVVEALGAVEGAGASPPAILTGTGYTPSADGRQVAFGGDGGGVWVYHLAANAEQAVESGKAKLTFAQWGADGSLIYGVGSGQSTALHRLAAASGGAASPQPSATAAAQ